MAECKHDYTGMRFGMLTAVRFDRRDDGGRSWWLWRCDCGSEKATRIDNVVRGGTRSCGCGHRVRTHGDARDGAVAPEYIAWGHLIQRCTNQRRKGYADYGGRGIKVCDRWLDYEAFLEDMGRKPSPKHSIDRIDNDRGYEPGNCRWASRFEQAANQRVRRTSKTGIRGVCLHKSGLYQWTVQRHSRRMRGYTKTVEAAVEARAKAAAELEARPAGSP